MSKRQDEKDRLAAKLAEGTISQRAYDERMKRMGHRGTASQQAKHAASVEQRAQARGVTEWSPDDPSRTVATLYSLSPKAQAKLTSFLAREGGDANTVLSMLVLMHLPS